MGAPGEIGPYRIGRVLGRGAMGVVYFAEHRETGTKAALKTVRGATASLISSIRREIAAMSRLHHPGVARIVDHGVADGFPWYAMELLAGETLRDRINAHFGAPDVPGHQPARGRWRLAPPLPAVLNLFHRICTPLTFLHSYGILHRDLKPENVFVLGDGRVVLVDFGVAMQLGESREYEIADHGFAGTPEYMSPEQILGREIDARADLYSVGCMLYECLTGAPPFEGQSVSDVISKQFSQAPVPPSAHVSGISHELEALVLKLLEKRPADRPGYADDLASQLVLLGAHLHGGAALPRPRAYVYRPDFVGRAAEMRRLERALDAGDATERTVVVRGESGAGKTRLLRELSARATTRGFAVVIAQCGSASGVPMNREVAPVMAPLHPFRAFLLRVADVCRECGAAQTNRILGARGPLLAPFETSLWLVPGAEAEVAPVTLAPESARARVFGALRDTLRAYANDRPILLLIDDLQWADELTMAFLSSCDARELDALQISIVCTFRAENESDAIRALRDRTGVVNLALDRLDAEEIGEMVQGMLAMAVAPRAFIDFLVGQADGNPFFVAEYLRAAIDRGLLHRDFSGGWQLRAGGRTEDLTAATLPPPPTIRELMAGRISDLDTGAAALAQSASVLGREFDEDLLHRMTETDEAAALELLRRRDIIEEANTGTLRFTHDRLRDLVYEAIPVEERRRLHGLAATTLESMSEGPLGRLRVLPELALHWSRAGEHARAAEHFVKAGDHARATYANGDALAHYDSALASLRVHWEANGNDGRGRDAVLHIEESRADILTLIAQHDAARQALRSALRDMPSHRRVWTSRLLWKLARTLETEHRHREALEVYDQAEQALGDAFVADVIDDGDDRAGSHWSTPAPSESESSWWHQWVQLQVERVWVHYWLADVHNMTARVERARPVVERRGSPAQRMRLFQALTHNNLRRERYVVSTETIGFARAALAAAEETADFGAISYAKFVTAFQLLFAGQLDESERLMHAAVDGAARTGDLALQARALTYLTVLFRLRGDVARTRATASASVDIATKLGMRDYLGAAHANLGWLGWRTGDAEQARLETSAALAAWHELAPQYPYPFQWLARLHAIAMALDQSSIDEAVDHAGAMLEPLQHRLPHGVLAAAGDGVLARRRGDATAAAHGLHAAIACARTLGYL